MEKDKTFYEMVKEDLKTTKACLVFDSTEQMTQCVISNIDFDKVTKLNEELEADNIRLVLFSEELQNSVKTLCKSLEKEQKNVKRLENSVREEVENYSRIISQNAEYSIELRLIKSTRLYKFFKRLGVW